MPSKYEIAVLACKVLAVYLFIQSFPPLTGVFLTLLTTVRSIDATGQLIAIGFALMYVILVLSISALLWFGSGFIAIKMTGGNGKGEGSAGGSVTQWGLMEAAFPVVGLVVLTNAVPRLIVFLVFRNQMGQFADVPRAMQAEMSASQISQVAGMAAQFCIGLYLLLGSNGLLRLLKKLRASQS